MGTLYDYLILLQLLILLVDQGFPNNNYMSPENIEPLDILRMYNGREVIIPANQIIAYLLNIRNESFLKYVMPWIYSNEVNWRTALREINLVTFAPVAEGSPFDTLTMRTGTWTDTTKKVKLGITIASGVYRDTIFGEDQFKFYMQGLAQCAQLTIMIKECFALTTLAYANACSDEDGKDYLNHSKVLNLVGSLFGILAHDPQIFYNRIEEIRRSDIPDLNTVIVPEKVLLFLEQLRGQPTTLFQEYIFPDNEIGKTNDIKIGTIKGPTSLTTINGISAFELKSFVFNSQRKQVVQPLVTTVVIARIWPHDPYDIHSSQCHDVFNPCMLDRKIYCHDKTYGDERFISYERALKNCFLFDKITHESSKHLKNFIEFQNREILNSNEMPAKWKLLKNRDGANFDVGSDDPYSHDKPIPGSFENKRTMEEQKGWRDSFVGSTFNPKFGPNGTYFVPRRVGDMNKESLPNCDIQKVSDSMMIHLKKHHGIDLDFEINSVKRFVSLIDESPWTNDYLNRLYITNLQRIRSTTINTPTQIQENYEFLREREDIYGKKIAQDWPSNIYGGFDLPEVGTTPLPLYPAGFASAAGLRTIAAQKNNPRSEYNGIAIEADRIVQTWEKIVEYIRIYISENSDIIDKFHTRPWFSKVSSLDALFEHILPHKPPLFLGMYDITILEELIKTKGQWGRNRNSFGNDATYQFFYLNKQSEEFKNIVNIINHQYYTEEDYKSINNFITTNNPLKFPEEIIPNRFWVLFILLSQKTSLEITDINKSKKITPNTLNDLVETIMKYILKDIPVTYTNIRNSVTTDVNFRNRISQSQTYIHYVHSNLSKIKEKDLANVKLEDIESKDPILSATDYETLIDKYISMKSHNVNLIFKDETKGDFVTMQEKAQDAFDLLSKTPSGDKTTIRMVGVDNTGNQVYLKSIPEPRFYIRTPLTATEQFIDFISTRPDVEGIDILPGDANTNYNFPVNNISIRGGTNDVIELLKVLDEGKIRLTSPKFDFTRFPVVEAFRLKHMKFETGSSKIDSGDDDDSDDYSTTKQKLFTTKESHKQQKKQKNYTESIFSVFSKGSIDKSMSLDAPSSHQRSAPTHYKQRKDSVTGGTGGDSSESFIKEFPGPWNKNIEYYKKMTSNGSALLFLGIIFSPFAMDVFANVAKLGLHLLKVDIMRNAEEHNMSSCIVMTAGSGTGLMVFGRIAVIPSIDGISGAITVSAEFHVGHVRINPKKISWIPYSVPDSFKGGCGDRFVEDPSQFFQLNETGRPDFFAIPTPVSQTHMSYPISIIGDGTFKAPDIDNTANIYRKHASSSWVNFILGKDKVTQVNIRTKKQTNYYQSIPVSFLCHLGAVRYADRKGDFPYVKPGAGAKQYVEMNILNAYLAWNGKGSFPKLTNSFKEY